MRTRLIEGVPTEVEPVGVLGALLDQFPDAFGFLGRVGEFPASCRDGLLKRVLFAQRGLGMSFAQLGMSFAHLGMSFVPYHLEPPALVFPVRVFRAPFQESIDTRGASRRVFRRFVATTSD